MRELAAELRAWAAEPNSTELPTGIEEALALARGAMQATFSDRDAEQAREAAGMRPTSWFDGVVTA